MSNFTDNILAQYKVTMKGEKELLRFLDLADRKAKALQKTLSQLRVPSSGFGFGGGGGRGGYGGGGGIRLRSIGTMFGQGGRGLGLGVNALGSFGSQGLSSLGSLAGVGGMVSSITGPIAGLGMAVAGLTTAFVYMSKAAADWIATLSRSGGELEATKLRVQSVSSEFDASPWAKLMAGRQKYKELRGIAKLPGIDVEDASTAYATLKFNEIGDKLAIRMLKGFGNFNAFVGGGQSEFGRIVYALQNIASSRGKGLSGQDLRQFANANVPIYRIMKDAFGVTDAKSFNESGHTVDEFFEKVTEWLETKVPRAADGALNAWENLDQAIKQAEGSIGEGLNKGGIVSIINKITSTLDELSDSGALESFGASIAGIFSSLDGLDFKDIFLTIGSYATLAAGALVGLGQGLGTFFTLAMDALESLPYVGPLIKAARSLISAQSEGLKADWMNEMELKKAADAALDRQRARHGGKTIQELAEEERLKKLANPKPPEDETESSDPVETIAKALESQTSKQRNYDLRRIMFGGDDLARAGVTPTELGAGDARNARFSLDVTGAERELVSFVSKIAYQILGELDRSGLMRSPRG